MSEDRLRANPAVAQPWLDGVPGKITEYVHSRQKLIRHAHCEDSHDWDEGLRRSEDIVVVVESVSKKKVSAESVKPQTDLIHHSSALPEKKDGGHTAQ